MAFASDLVSRIGEIKGRPRVKLLTLLSVFAVYSKPFSRVNCHLYFRGVHSSVVWIDNSTFKVCGAIFAPKTMSDFISICSSLGIPLVIDLDDKANKWMI
jgi:hypothetical protein